MCGRSPQCGSLRCASRAILLSTRDTRDWRPLILLAVFHMAIVLLVIRAARLPISLSTPMNEPLLLLLLPHKARATADLSTPSLPAGQSQLAASKARASKPVATASNAIIEPKGA